MLKSKIEKRNRKMEKEKGKKNNLPVIRPHWGSP
jgi:deoxyadenosine/deoxycytidine kinase